MKIKNVEFKAKVSSLKKYETLLHTLNPRLVGTDLQTDTYFKAPQGRLKLREGNIENALINYNRNDVAALKLSEILLYKHLPSKTLKDILSLQFGVDVVVEKERKIYFINHIKFHFDRVAGLGYFIEVEAIDENNQFTPQELKKQCDFYFNFFKLTQAQLVSESYSDLIRKQQG